MVSQLKLEPEENVPTAGAQDTSMEALYLFKSSLPVDHWRHLHWRQRLLDSSPYSQHGAVGAERDFSLQGSACHGEEGS